jgi:hypothetical protein
MIVKDQTSTVDEQFRELKTYVQYHFGTDLTELHQKVTTNTKKKVKVVLN